MVAFVSDYQRMTSHYAPVRVTAHICKPIGSMNQKIHHARLQLLVKMYCDLSTYQNNLLEKTEYLRKFLATLFAVSVSLRQSAFHLTWHISVIVSSNTPPASSAPSPTSFTFQARDGSLSSSGFRLTTCFAICTKMGLLERPLWECQILVEL